MESKIQSSQQHTISVKHQHILQMLEFRLQSQNETFNSLEQKAQQAINISGILAAVIGGFSLSNPVVINLFQISLLAVIIMFFFLCLGTSIASLWPRKWLQPVASSDNQIAKLRTWYDKAIDAAYFQNMFDTYIEIVTTNDKILATKWHFARISLMMAIVQIGFCLLFVLARIIAQNS